MSRMFEVRRTSPEDAARLRTIRLTALESDPSAFGSSLELELEYPDELWVERAAGSESSRMFVAEAPGDGDGSPRLVGLAGGYRPDPSGPAELVSMWTDPAVRGRGVGRSLVESVVTWAIELGVAEVRLWVTRGNDSAQRLYERCGFEATDEVGVAPSDPCREEIRMVLTL